MPFREINWSKVQWRTIAKGIFLLLFCGTGLFIFESPLKGKLYLGNNDIKINKNWIDKISSANTKINGKDCNATLFYSDQKLNNLIENCKINNPVNLKERTIAFVGDSHTLAMMDSQKMIYKEGNNLIHYSFNGCPFPYPINGIYPSKCNSFLRLITDKVLKDLKKGDFIVINNYDLTYLGDKKTKDVRHHFYDKHGNLTINKDEKFKIYTNSLIEFSNKADIKGIEVIFIGSGMRNLNPILSYPQWFRPFPKNNLNKENKISKSLNNSLKNKLRNINNITFIDPLEIIACCEDIKSYFKFYRDADHLSNKGSEVLTKEIISIINK